MLWNPFQVLKEDITPTLSKLREERSSYLEYQKIIRELEHLNKLYIAYQFVCAEVWLSFAIIMFLLRDLYIYMHLNVID